MGNNFDFKGYSDLVEIGDILKLEIITANRSLSQTVKLVGEEEVNVENDVKEVSINSPLGSAIYGKNVGDVVEYFVGPKSLTASIEEKVNQKDLEHVKVLK